MKKLAKNIPTYYDFPGTPIFRDTTALPFADGGPLHDRDINGNLLNSTYASPLGNMYREGGPFGEDQGTFDYAASVYASQPGNYFKDGGQFQGKYSLPEDSFKQGGNNLHNSVYASSPQQYPAIYNFGGTLGNNLSTRQQMYMPLDHITRTGGSILSMSNTPEMSGEGKDLVYANGGTLNNSYAGGGQIYTYAGRPGAEYRKSANGWTIRTESTNGAFITVKDPTGKRSAILNKNATIYTNPAKFKKEYDPLLDVTAAIEDNTVVRNSAVIDKNLTENTANQKKLERDIVASKIKSNPMLSEQQKTDTLLDPRKLDDYSYLAYENTPERLKAAKDYSTYDKIENIVRNPLVAATYAMQPGTFNMPMNYSELERSPDYSDETWNRNAMGQGINAARYFHPVGLAASAADNLIYTGDDTRKAIESGKLEDWQKAGMSGVNTALDLLGSRYIGNSGRLLNAGEQATLNAMKTSNKLGLNPNVNNYLGTKVFPNLSTSGIQSADNLIQAKLFPQLNPMSSKYNPLVKNLYNKGVTAGQAQNIKEAAESGGGKVFGNFDQDIIQGTEEAKNLYNDAIIPTNNALDKLKKVNSFAGELAGSFKPGRTKTLREAENWTKNWVQHPATQEKIINSYKEGLKLPVEGYVFKKTGEVPNAKHNLEEAIKFSSGYNPTGRLKEYPLLNQLMEYPRPNIHKGNSGVSYTHSDIPGQFIKNENTFVAKGELSPLPSFDIYPNALDAAPAFKRHGNWISRTLDPDKRLSSGVHELGHDWVKDKTLKVTDQENIIKDATDNSYINNVKKAYPNDAEIHEGLDYLAKPTEIHARLMEARKYFNLTPDQVVTPDQADYMLTLISAGKTPINSQFPSIIKEDGKAAANLFNKVWGIVPAAGIAGGATLLANPWQQQPKGL